MRELFFFLFKPSHFNTGIAVTAFSVSHIIYLILIIGSIIGLYFLLRNKAAEQKKKAMGILVNLIIFSYVSDFFVHEFVNGTIENPGGLNIDKLPFHLCTCLGVLSPFVQYNKKFEKIKEPVVLTAIFSSLAYLVYPAAITDSEPWCYEAFQTMFFHGTLLTWGTLNLLLGVTKLDIKKCYREAIFLVCFTLWAKLGNLLFEHNWYFLAEDVFYIGLVGNGIIPQWSLMIINPVMTFAAVLGIYGIYYLVLHIKEERQKYKAKMVHA